jgi:GTP-binding protein Era
MNTETTSANFRCGYIAIVGRPNVGKSTLMNTLIGAKVSITSRKAQTTRHRITGIQTHDDAQFIYVDTPGFQTRHANALNKTLNKTVTNTLISSDLILYVIEAGTFGPADQQVLDLLPTEVPVVLVINKADRVKDKAVLLPFAQQVAAKFNFAAIVPVSAKLRFQLDGLEKEIKKFLPENQPIFGPDDITDRSEEIPGLRDRARKTVPLCRRRAALHQHRADRAVRAGGRPAPRVRRHPGRARHAQVHDHR